jgi:hypothetical protein
MAKIAPVGEDMTMATTSTTTTGLAGFAPGDNDDKHQEQELNEPRYYDYDTECDSLIVPLEMERSSAGRRNGVFVDDKRDAESSYAAHVVSTVFSRCCGGSNSSSRISSMSSDNGQTDSTSARTTLRRVMIVVHAIWGSILLLVLIMDVTLFIKVGHVGRFWYYKHYEALMDKNDHDDDSFSSYLPSSNKNLLDVVALGILGLTAVAIGIVSLCLNHSRRGRHGHIHGNSRGRCLVRVATIYYHGLFLFYGGMCLMHIDITLSNGIVFKIGCFYRVATVAWLVMALLHVVYHRNVYAE